MMPLVYTGKGAKVLVSRHRDGEFIHRAMRLFGIGTVRGSSTRGGVPGMKDMIRALERGYDIGITPDGPRGPRYIVQPGVTYLAKVTGHPIVPLSFSASRRKIFNSWDRFLVPCPFSRGVYIYGDPVWVDRNADEDEIAAQSSLLQKRLMQITDAADHYYG
jgi:hypothetical protein